MKTLTLLFLTALSSQAAQAATIVCSGSVQKYDFVITAKTSGEGFAGKASADITRERKPYKKVVMPIVAGEYNPRLLNFLAKDAKNQAIVQAVRVNGGGYKGEITLSGEDATSGETKLSITCQVR